MIKPRGDSPEGEIVYLHSGERNLRTEQKRLSLTKGVALAPGGMSDGDADGHWREDDYQNAGAKGLDETATRLSGLALKLETEAAIQP